MYKFYNFFAKKFTKQKFVKIMQNQQKDMPHTQKKFQGNAPSMKEVWKEAQREVRQHWFIDSYIAAYCIYQRA
jgi:hypothetical protein